MVEAYGANFEASDVLRMFPTFVWKAQVAPSVRQGIEDDVLAKLEEMRRAAGEPAPGRGWQAEKDLHHLADFRGLDAWCFLTGVYYVRTHEGADTVNFHDPRPQTGIIRPPVTELTAENTDQVVVKLSDGTLLVFPSWLPHSVDASGSGETRISISFNIMPPAYKETMSKPQW